MQGNYRPMQRKAAPMDRVLSGRTTARGGSDKVMLSLRVDRDLKARFKAVCLERDVTMEEAGERAILDWLRE
ncbi:MULTISPECIES: hypothetical protein [Bifidobacterium]|uniref:hypothetical protein n=1 Tax=Bifidobacterium TaxID=1678 RepID=UPI0026486202|nr:MULTISPECIES: hypothetical protein [Bifidobacterium]MDN5978661.1 hypothetical protein [Bifidobacterium mongoliense]MDN6558724.1 hypothetical protein [Bifidobacterium crudilactis]MDN6622260.1 hypothetical protein [Bifidobacterium crudilactis]MDN6772647.1 hypothetical protein [Bifidobacterium crudilactis]MDN6804715.1 hypothetical protein [Bifidobacterium crudilactis]